MLASLSIRSDLRTASRGDGGADELRRVMDGFMSAGASAYNAQTQADMPKYREEAAEGSLDAATDGVADPARARSVSYQEAFFSVKAEASFNTFSAQTRAAVDDALNNDASPEEVHALVIAGITDFRDQVIDTIPTASAQRATAARLSAMGMELDGVVNTRIRERNREEFVAAQGGNIAAALAAWPPEVPISTPAAPPPIDGELPGPEGSPEVPAGTEAPSLDIQVTGPRAPPPLPVEAWIATYRQGGFTGPEAKTHVVNALTAAATNRNDPRPELLEQLLDSTQADGKTPTLNPAEIIQVQNSLSQARNLETSVETERHNAERDDTVEALFTRALAGEIVDDAVIAAGQSGVFTPQETAGTLGLLNGLRSAVEDGQVNDTFVAEVQRRIAMGRPMSNSEILAAEAAGRFGTGLSAKRAATQALITPARVRGGGGELSEAERGRQVQPSGMTRAEERAYAWDELKDELFAEDGSPYERRDNAHTISYFNSLQDGRRGRLQPAEALAQTRTFITNMESSRQRQAGRAPAPPAPIPTGRVAVSPGSYSWGPSGQRQ